MTFSVKRRPSKGLVLYICVQMTIILPLNSFLVTMPKPSRAALRRQQEATDTARPLSENAVDDVSSMRVSEIKNELKDLNIEFTDCFDKESLVGRLRDARSGKATPSPTVKSSTTVDTPKEQSPEKISNNSCSTDTGSDKANSQPQGPTSEEFDEVSAREDLRSMSVRSLREELASRNIRWAGLLDKEDLIRAALEARKEAFVFSSTGAIIPGQVAELSGVEVVQEVEDTNVKAPLLLDVYATWCGPCQMMAPQLKLAAEEWGDKIRVAKMDSDKNGQEASRFKVQGLPSLILFVDGKEKDRIEGALMKDQLLEWVANKL